MVTFIRYFLFIKRSYATWKNISSGSIAELFWQRKHRKSVPEFTLGFLMPAGILQFHLRGTEEQEIVKLRYAL